MLKRCDVIFRYDGSLEGLLCCVFESYRSHRLPLDIWTAEEPRLSLVPEFSVPSRREEAARVWRRLRQLSPDAATWVRTGFLSGEEDKAMALHSFLCLVFDLGRKATGLLGDPVVARAFQLQRQVQNEACRFLEFLRFQDLGGLLTARIEPEAFVLPLMSGHFAERFPGEAFLIHDAVHGAALFHQEGRTMLFPVEKLELPSPTPEEKRFQSLWRRYYNAVSIRERENSQCRRSHCPKRFWKDMTEFCCSPPKEIPGERAVPSLPAREASEQVEDQGVLRLSASSDHFEGDSGGFRTHWTSN